MTIVKQQGEESLTLRHSAVKLPKLRWMYIMAISIFWFALNFHWSALGLIILPSQVLKIVGDLNKGQALAFVIVPGAFVSLFANPLFGMLSDQTRGKLALWGRRRPYIVLGTLVNVAALIWMTVAWDIPSLTIAYIIVQFSNNAASAPFHALLPDFVPEEQRGLASGMMSMLSISGSMSGVIVAGLLVDAAKSLRAYQQGLALTYGIIIVILVALMLITVFAVDERKGMSVCIAEQEPTQGSEVGERAVVQEALHPRLRRTTLYNVVGIALAVLLTWGLMTLWNMLNTSGIQVRGDVQQGILMLIISLGILRLFDFSPHRNPDFAWVLVTRLLMMMGIYTIQTFLQYYLRDVIGVPNPEQETSKFVIIAAFTGLVSAIFAGWLSDRLGRKRIVYIAGGMMALLSLIIIITNIFTRSLPIIFVAGAFFGIGGGAYQSVDWALVADVLPSPKDYAKDMGIWNISISLPQVIAPVIGGPLIDVFTQRGMPVVGFQLLFGMAIVYCLVGTAAVRFIRGVKR